MYSLIANIELLLMNLLLTVLLFAFNIRHWKPKILNPLSMIYILVMVGCIFEMSAFYADGHPELIWLNYLSNIIYMSSIGLISASMVEYSSDQFPKPIWKNHTQHLLILLPILFELIVLISAPKTGLVFYVAPDGSYHRSSTFFLQMIPYGYLLLTTYLGIYWFLRTETTKERHQYLAIALFAVPPIFLGGTQLLIKANTLDILEFSIILSLLANYAVSQNNRITRDTLTKLPNREVLDNILAEDIKNVRKEKHLKLFVIMCDLDNFKQINDNYGHPEGDRALIVTADVLYKICKRYKATAARLGGDEFTITMVTDSEEKLQKLSEEIEDELCLASQDKPYTLKMSMGYALFRPSDTIPDIMKAADKELYRVKAERKTLRS